MSLLPKNKEIQPDEFGFTAIYKEILYQTFPSRKIETLLYWSSVLIAMPLATSLSNAAAIQGFSRLINVNLIFIIFALFSLITIVEGWVFGFIYHAFVPLPSLSWLTARIIVAFKSPYQNHVGLNAAEIRHLLAIAEADQSSADWKNGFLSIGVLALLLVAIQSSFASVSDLLDKHMSAGLFSGLVLQPEIVPIFFVWAIIIVLLYSLAQSIFRPLGEFLANEPINQTIINACHEALALLDAVELDQKKALSFAEKKKIVKACDCLLVPETNKDEYWFMAFVHSFQGSDNKIWLLLAPGAKDAESERLIRVGKRWRLRFASFRSLFKRKKG